MKVRNLARVVNDHFVKLGPFLYISSVQYFVVQVLAAIRFRPPYSLSSNTISDLGNTLCGQFRGHFVCSPLHPLMNLSFLVLGCTMFLGSSLVRQQFSANRATTVGMAALAIAGVGVALVGLFPENTVASVHTIGSALPFAVGNAGIFVLGVALELPALWRVYTLCTGAFSLAALALFVSHVYVGVGEGGMERAVAYPQTVWLIALGIYLLRRKKAEGSHRKVTNSDDGGHRVSL